jgi:hypothetical protein
MKDHLHDRDRFSGLVDGDVNNLGFGNLDAVSGFLSTLGFDADLDRHRGRPLAHHRSIEAYHVANVDRRNKLDFAHRPGDKFSRRLA